LPSKFDLALKGLWKKEGPNTPNLGKSKKKTTIFLEKGSN
jgi:hypothetical protein